MGEHHSHFKIVIIGGLIIVAFVYYGLHHAKTAVAPVVPPSLGTVNGAWASDKIDEKIITDEGKGYSIRAAYPVTGNSAVTAYFKNFVDEQISSFKAELVPADMPDSVTAYTLDVTYTQERSARADNFIFLIAADTGGAHGLQATKTFSFTPEGKIIALGDLFINGVQGLASIAPYVQKELLARDMTDEDWVKEGAAPTEDNYQSFVVTDTGVRFIFDPYQVAAYAAGTQQVDVPVSVFRLISSKSLFTR